MRLRVECTFFKFTNLGANPRRIGDRLVWAVRSIDLTHWTTRALTQVTQYYIKQSMNNWVDSKTRMHILIRLSTICFLFQNKNERSIQNIVSDLYIVLIGRRSKLGGDYRIRRQLCWRRISGKPVVYATCIVVVWYINVLNDVIVFLLYYRKR